MNRSTIQNSLADLNNLVQQGNLMEAFEKYYHQDIAMQENSNPPVVGKDVNRKRELEFVANIQDFRSASVEGLGIGDDISFVIWKYDYTHKEWGVRNYTQVSVQNWQDGKIIKEQFFYGN